MRHFLTTLVAAATACGCSESPGDAAATCAGPAVNAEGVGQPCRTRADCTGTAAVTCPIEDDPAGYAFCSRTCFDLAEDECGADATCLLYVAGRGWCVPKHCEASLPHPEILPPEDVTVPCCVGAVNDLGVGKLCTKHSDCAGQAATSCPQKIHAGLPNWCTFLCTPGDDCGPGAFCWWRPSAEGGFVGSCAPTVCLAENGGGGASCATRPSP